MGENGAGDSNEPAGMEAPRLGEDSATVMVTVKTYPNPSEKYLETVCVAGVRLDRGQPEWIRLYPVRFRNEDFDRTFKKYDVIEVIGTYHQANDVRPESFRPRQDEMRHVEWLGTSSNWQRRRANLDGLIGETTMCDLLAQNPVGEMVNSAPSLGLIKPRDVKVTVQDGLPWSASEQAKIDKASAPDLFGSSLVPLEPAPFIVKYKYKCATAMCRGHEQKVLDWEAGQGGRKWLRDYGDRARAREAMVTKWRDEMLAVDNDVYFYVGNQNARHWTFSVLGVWRPKVENALF